MTADNKAVFAAGIDARVTMCRRVDQGEAGAGAGVAGVAGGNWVYTSAHRPHTHDVYALLCLPSKRGPAGAGIGNGNSSSDSIGRAVMAAATEVLVSAGQDCKLCMYSAAHFAQCRPAWLLPVPAHSLLSMQVQCSQSVVFLAFLLSCFLASLLSLLFLCSLFSSLFETVYILAITAFHSLKSLQTLCLVPFSWKLGNFGT